jgi:hypothetical protein
VLVVPAADAASVLCDSALRPYRTELDVVTGGLSGGSTFRDRGRGAVALVRPDGHLAARGRPDDMHTVTGDLRDLFGEPDHRRLDLHLADGALHAVRGTAADRD